MSSTELSVADCESTFRVYTRCTLALSQIPDQNGSRLDSWAGWECASEVQIFVHSPSDPAPVRHLRRPFKHKERKPRKRRHVLRVKVSLMAKGADNSSASGRRDRRLIQACSLNGRCKHEIEASENLRVVCHIQRCKPIHSSPPLKPVRTLPRKLLEKRCAYLRRGPWKATIRPDTFTRFLV